MADADKAPDPGEAGAALAGGNYEVIRQRLIEQARALGQKADDLNTRRKATFGGTELTVIGNERVRTENNCVPRDIVAVHDLLLFGYEVFLGLKSATTVGDVFCLHRFGPDPDGGEGAFHFTPAGADAADGFISRHDFVREFSDLYKYYRDARFLRLRKTDTRLLAIFQVGEALDDIKVFRWRIEGDGRLDYIDMRGDRDHVLPPSHDFEWTTTTRDDHVGGEHPHVNIQDTIFVETVEGDLTVKVEDNTATGSGIYEEPVEDANQTLDDAEIHFSRLGGLILLKILPYREQDYRYLVFNTRDQSVVRIDNIGLGCVQLPENHGILFPGGYYLQTGVYKVFDGDTSGLEFERVVRSPNGEDVLYVFHRPRDGRYSLFPYNIIRKEVQTPIHCNGYSLFDDGRMVVFRAASSEPTRVHPMQIWQTPFTSAEFAASAPTDGSFLAKVGNADLVRGISDCYSIKRLCEAESPNRATFEDLIKSVGHMGDAYYWLDHPEVGDLRSTIKAITRTVELIIDEFEKVIAFRQRAAEAMGVAEADQAKLTARLRPEDFADLDAFMKGLTAIRHQRGRLITLKEVRYIDRAKVEALEVEAGEAFDTVSRACVDFLLGAQALAPLSESIEALLQELEATGKVTEVVPLVQRTDQITEGLDLISEVVSGLQIDDATKRTAILEDISEVFGQLNRVRATIEGRRKALLSHEGKAEFAAQFKLLSQSTASALALCDTPEKCDEQLSRLMVQLEELEGRFSEFDEFLGDLASRREEVYEAFAARKQTLVDERQRRTGNLANAANRILEGVGRRARSFKGDDELNAYFASDSMVMKLRQIVVQLRDLGDSVKADELDSKLKSAGQDARRGLRDREDLYEEGENVIKLGRHRFSVNTQPLELTMVPRDDGMYLHLTGCDFYEKVDDDDFAATREYWDQTIVSESSTVYRGEYLAATVLFEAEAGGGGLSLQGLRDAIRDGTLVEVVRQVAADRYDEGYERGLHDQDAALILEQLLTLYESADLLRFGPTPRALACLWWASMGRSTAKRGPGTGYLPAGKAPPKIGLFAEQGPRDRYRRRGINIGRLRGAFGPTPAAEALAADLAAEIGRFVEASGLEGFSQTDRVVAGAYLVEELAGGPDRFVAHGDAVAMAERLLRFLDDHGGRLQLTEDLEALQGQVAERLDVARAWVQAYLQASPEEAPFAYLAVEVAVLLLDEGLSRQATTALTTAQAKGLLGQHPSIRDRTLAIRIDEFMDRLRHFADVRVPGFRRYRELRGALLERQRDRLRLDEYKPKVMTSFVRNKLISEVYLPMVGDNLAKQMGTVGAGKRTDLMGLLLLVSPPGYGKTTLMEYVANRLGLTFVKINGPALGHAVRSIDPEEAPNATARQEVEKINFAFEMGNNVMLYLDDIQHTHAELLQKFISLCDAQRRVEGVWKGRTRTYDLRGKKFCVIMAGNPYTESGEKFQIPDMLANRADTYNLGDILEGRDEVFALSYVENAITSNEVLAPLAARDRDDIYKLVRMAHGEQIPSTDLEHGYAAVELTEIVAVLQRLIACQRVVLQVNQQYIQSAAQDDAFRTEPRFQLQGSYRNMNKLAEKVVSAMNEVEVQALLDDHYQGESQTLTSGAEHNLLKLAEMRGRMSDEQAERWAGIKREFMRRRQMGGSEDDPVMRVTGTLAGIGQQLEGIGAALTDPGRSNVDAELAGIGRGLAALQKAAEAVAARPIEIAVAGPPPGTAQGGAAELAAPLAQLAQALQAVSRPRLEVKVAPPAGLQELLRNQVSIVERTLVPLIETTTEHLGDAQRINAHLVRLIELLKSVDQRLRGG